MTIMLKKDRNQSKVKHHK